MGTPFKMKGSPMKRNFGVGASPVKHMKMKGMPPRPVPHSHPKKKCTCEGPSGPVYYKCGETKPEACTKLSKRAAANPEPPTPQPGPPKEA